MKFKHTYLFNQSTAIVNSSGYYQVMQGCNAYVVTNVGDTIVEFNGHILYPGTPGTTIGDSFTFGGHPGEIFVGTMKVQFQPPVGVAPALEIIQKFYPEIQ